MKTAAPALLPLLRSRSQGEILAQIILRPDADQSLVEIAHSVGVSPATVMREVDRLEEAGLITSTRRGNTRLVRARTDHPVYRPLADLMAVTFGPLGVLREALATVPNIDHAYLYGSWAARHQGQPGPVPGDLDVLVIGTPDRTLLDDAIEEAERRLRREVNVRTVTAATWADDTGSFKTTITSRPMVTLIGDDDA